MKAFLHCLLILMLAFALLSNTACNRNTDILKIGIIKPSINHLPLTFALQKKPEQSKHYKIINFVSGWEVQEALAAGKLDMAILPFTYAWTLRAKGYKVKTLACLERETDGIVTTAKIKLPNDLNRAKIGLLRASSLEALMDDFAAQNAITYTPVYFRSPTEMTAALARNKVDAIVSYVPLIQKMPAELHVLHWFAEDYQEHPCCNLVVTELALKNKLKPVQRMAKLLQPGIDSFNTKSRPAADYLTRLFALTPPQAADALKHVKYQSYISEQDMVFERTMMQDFVRKGYLAKLPPDTDMYYISEE